MRCKPQGPDLRRKKCSFIVLLIEVGCLLWGNYWGAAWFYGRLKGQDPVGVIWWEGFQWALIHRQILPDANWVLSKVTPKNIFFFPEWIQWSPLKWNLFFPAVSFAKMFCCVGFERYLIRWNGICLFVNEREITTHMQRSSVPSGLWPFSPS